MVRHPTARRVQRQSTEPEDAFVAQVFHASTWARKHARTLIIAGIVAAVLVLGTLWYISYRATQREVAEEQLLQAMQTVSMGNNAVAERELTTFLEQYGGTPSAAHARVLLGQVYLQSNQAPKAIEVLQKPAGDLDSPLGPAAALLLGAAYEAANQPAQAEKVYLSVGADAPLGFQQREGLDRAGLLRMQAGNGAGAAQLYERLLEMTPDDVPGRGLYEIRLGEARALGAKAT